MVKKRKKQEIGAPEWDLSDLYAEADDPKIDVDLAKAAEAAEVFESQLKGQVKHLTEAAMIAALTDYEAILEKLSKIGTYPGLLSASDTSNDIFKSLETKVETKITEIKNHLLFFELELFELDEAEWDNLLSHQKLADFRHYLGVLRQWKPYHLSFLEERVLNEKSPTSSGALGNIFQNFVSGMVFKTKVGKETKTLSETELLHLLHHHSRDIRKNAADAFSAGLSQNAGLFTDLYNYSVQDYAVETKLRGHQYPEERRNLSNEITREAVSALVSASAAGMPLAARYYALKGKILGVSPLYEYDRYAPLKASRRAVSYQEAKKVVLDAYYAFDKRMGMVVEEFYEKNWVDAKVRPGKRGGAFCSSPSPDLHPYVLTNFQGSLRDVMTEAHELGHGAHGMLARAQRFLDYDTPLTMAETASVFGEMLVFESLKNQAFSDEEKLSLLTGKIEDIIATVFRQIAMYKFEARAHYYFREHGRISTEKLNAWWNEEQQAIFGDSLTLRPEHGCWWMYIPHIIHTPFYVYAYAFGELLTLSLYAKYKSGEPDFEEMYVKLLSAGGSRSPGELLADFGANPADENFWREGLKVFENFLKEAEELAEKLGY